MQLDYIIVGQGLAGSILSYQLIKRDLKLLVFDDPALPKSSTVAAGIYNPFTGRKLVRTWMAEQLFPFLLEFYSDLEMELGTQLLYDLPIYRPFLSKKEQNQWGGRISEPGYSQFIDSIVAPSAKLSQVENPLGGMILKKSGFVAISRLIAKMASFLNQHDAIRNERFSIPDLQIARDQVRYKKYTARRLIFCDGSSLQNNFYFNWLPLKPVKGEILDIELEEPLDYIPNRGVFILPIAGNHYRVGSTFDHSDLTWKATKGAKTQLLQKLDKLLRIPYRVTGQTAGIRPASLDRRPLIGLHPKYEPLGVFNGLGTKGVSLAPYFAHEFFQFLERGKPLIEDVTINRYFSLYYNKI